MAIAKQGKPVTISFLEEGIINGEKCCSILKSGRNYDNAKTLLTWFLSDKYIGSIVKNKIPFVLPADVESFKDEYIDYTKVNFLKTDFNLKLKNHDKYIEDFRNYVLKDRLENF